jgi:hypothetical protein
MIHRKGREGRKEKLFLKSRAQRGSPRATTEARLKIVQSKSSCAARQLGRD